MRILALISQKGGSGKTTLAVHLAVAVAQDGERVVLLDADPRASTRAWAPRAPEVAEAAAALATHGVPVAPVRIGERRAYARAVAGGRAVTEFEPRGKAAQEITVLWRWVHEQLLSGEEARV